MNIGNELLSKLRQNYTIYYLDQQNIRGMSLLGEVAVVKTKNGTAYSIDNNGKIIELKGDKVYPPEIRLDVLVKKVSDYDKCLIGVKKNKLAYDLEKVYQESQNKLISLENIIYNKLLKIEGKGKLFIRVDFCVQTTDIKDTFLFFEVIYVVKGDII